MASSVFKPHPEYVQGRRTALCLGATKGSETSICNSFFGSPIFDANTLHLISSFDLGSEDRRVDAGAVRWELETKFGLLPRDYRTPSDRGTPIEAAIWKDDEANTRKFELLVHTPAYYDLWLERLNRLYQKGRVRAFCNRADGCRHRAMRMEKAIAISRMRRSVRDRALQDTEAWMRGLEAKLREQEADPDAVRMSRRVLWELVRRTDDWPDADATPEGAVRITTLRPHCAWIVVYHNGKGRTYVMGANPGVVFDVHLPTWATFAFQEW